MTRVAASLAGHGAGDGNCPIEPFIAVADLQGRQHGCDLFALQDAPTTSYARCRTVPCKRTARRSPSATRADVALDLAGAGR